MPKIYGQLESASLENISSPPSAGTTGRLWFDTTAGRTAVDDGTLIRFLLRNDQKCIFGNSGTAANNVRLHRGANGVLQFVSGADTTAEGTLSTALNQISAKQETYPAASLPAFGNAGRVAYVSDTGFLNLDIGSAWKVLVDTNTAQTLSSKTLTSPTINTPTISTPEITGAETYNQISTPSNPAANKNKLYFKSDDQIYILNSAGVEKSLTNIVYTAPVVTTYLSGSGTHTFTGSPLYVVVKMVGGGGGGGSGGSGGTNGGDGTSTQFGSGIFAAGGGGGGTAGGGAANGGNAGTPTVGGGATALALMGGAGTGGQAQTGGGATAQGPGASSMFGGAGAAPVNGANGGQGQSGTGAGGQGGMGTAGGVAFGGSGGSGAYIEGYLSGAVLSGLAGSASYAVGTGGAGGSGGASGTDGGAGGSGSILVIEYYQ